MKIDKKRQDLRNKRKLYHEYHRSEKLKQLVSEIPCGHNFLLMRRCGQIAALLEGFGQ